MLLTKIKNTIRHYSMVEPGDRVLVAVSGGPDSVCLLSVLHALSVELDLSLHVAHLDHMFRGTESAGEALFVNELAKNLGIPATIEQFDVPAFCRERGLSVQEGAREVRYGFFSRVAAATGATRIATGHTADDQAETFIMRLLRGAGTAGLSAIPPIRENIIRPLIDVTREEITDHIKAHGLEYKTDPSNTKPLYTRNRVRLEVIPLLKRFNPRVVETLASEASLLRDEDEAMESYVATMIESIVTENEDGLFIQRDEFNTLPPAFRRRLFRRLAKARDTDTFPLSLDQVNNALAFMASAQTGRTMTLPRSITITREYNAFVINTQKKAEGFSYTLMVPDTTSLPELGLVIETRLASDTSDQEEINNFWQAVFDYDKINSRLTLRSRHPGDSFCPAGMGGKHKKLQDFFVDEKVPKRKRDTVPILCSGDDILWVAGLRTDERFLPTKNTAEVVIVQVRAQE